MQTEQTHCPSYHCPKCALPMQVNHYGRDIALQRCPNCQGIWCPGVNVDDLLRVPMIDILDVGDAKVGAVYNRIEQVSCPECQTRMHTERIEDQPHITVDACSSCHGVFFDAGELRDLRHITLGDWLKAIRFKLSFAHT